MKPARLRFSTEILRRLGEELNPSPDQGILELVKNSYDANARHCKISVSSIDSPGGTVIVVDDGDGMDDAAIMSGWLVIGSSSKSPKKKTRLGRVPAGSKGLGRLAALRLGSEAFLRTRPRDESTEYRLAIDWSAFDSAKHVDDVSLRIETISSSRRPTGTEIVLNDLRSKIGRMEVKRLARSLVLLADPFGDDPAGFEPTLVAPEFSDLEELVRARYFEQADYHLIADLDRSGHVSVRVVDWKAKALFADNHAAVATQRKGAPYSCPPARLDLWVFLRNKDGFAWRTASVGDVRRWLQTFGGVHVYHNGIRVSPYGNPGNDWLDMNLRRAQSPEERPSTNTSLGRVAIYDTQGVLVQKTDRSGFIEDEEFDELRTFARDSLEWLANRRMDVAEKRRAKTRTEGPKKVRRLRKSLLRAIGKAPAATQESLQLAVEAYDRSREKEAQGLRREVQLYRTLSTAGIMAATFAHESSGNSIKIVDQSIRAIERRARKLLGDDYAMSLEQPVERIAKALESFAVLGSATLSLLDHDKRRVGRVEIHSVVSNVLKLFKPFFEGRDVEVATKLMPGEPYLRGTEAALESVLTNLISNSLVAFEHGGTSSRKIGIATSPVDGSVALTLSDNGPGIEGISLKDIWLPGRTTRPHGTGLGLTIVHDTVKDLGGAVEAVENGDMGGAQFTITLPILGV